MESAPCGGLEEGWTIDLSRFPGWGNFFCVLVGGAGSLLSGVQLVSSSEFWGVYGFGMALGIPSFNVQCCVSVLLEN